MLNSEKQLPYGWEWTTLGKLANYINGRAFKPTDWETTGRPIIRIQNLTGSTDTVNRFSGEVEPKYIIRDGDLLISWSATLGAFIYKGEEAVLNQHIFKVEPFVNKKFLYYLVTAFLDTLKRQVHGSGMQHITKGKFDNSPVPLPPPDEQERIVAKIEELFTQLEAGTSGLERVRAGLRRYKASVLKAAVEGSLLETRELENSGELPEGWRWATVSELADEKPYSITDGPFGSKLKTEHYTQSGPRVIRLQNIGDGEFRDEKAHISQEHFETLKRHRIYGGDLVIAGLGESLPRACIIPDYVGDAIVKADCIRFKPNHIFTDTKYLLFALNSEPVKKLVAKVVHGVGRPRMNQQEIKAIPIPLPPLEDQRRIVAEVERRLSVARQVENSVKEALVRASRLRQAVLKSAFEGRL